MFVMANYLLLKIMVRRKGKSVTIINLEYFEIINIIMYLEPFAVIGGERYQTLNQVITITFLFFNSILSLG